MKVNKLTDKIIKETVGKLTDTECVRIRFLREQLDSLVKDPAITEENYRKVCNIAVEIHILKELYINRMITLMKRGDQI